MVRTNLSVVRFETDRSSGIPQQSQATRNVSECQDRSDPGASVSVLVPAFEFAHMSVFPALAPGPVVSLQAGQIGKPNDVYGIVLESSRCPQFGQWNSCCSGITYSVSREST